MVMPLSTKKIYALDVILDEAQFHRVQCAHFDKRFFLSFVVNLSPENLRGVAERFRGWAERLESVAKCLERGSIHATEAVLAGTSGSGSDSDDYASSGDNRANVLPGDIPGASGAANQAEEHTD